MKSCPQCQYPNPDSRNDCFKCGVPLDGSAAARVQPPQPAPESPFSQPGPYAGAGQPPPGYQSPSTSYSTPLILPQAHTTPINRGLWTGLAVIFVIILFWGIRFWVGHSITKNIDKGTNPNNYTVVSCSLEASGLGLPAVKGQIYNNTNYNVRMATVFIDLYDANGKKIGIASDFTTEWTPHENWTFEAMMVDPMAASAQISKVTMSLIK